MQTPGCQIQAPSVALIFDAIKAKEKGISKVVFDRNGYKFHGRVKAFADTLRENGLQF